MVTIKEIRELKKQGEYREIIGALEGQFIDVANKEDAEKYLELAWAHHQLGEYDRSIAIMSVLTISYPASTEIGESARRGYAHGLLQRDGDVEESDKILMEIAPGLSRDNVRMNQMIMAARKGLTIPVELVMSMIVNALKTVPYATINGHIINNGVLVLHEARNQEGVKPYIPILPGLIDNAIGIYEATGTAKNHIAGAEFRAAQICRANGLPELAQLSVRRSTDLWRELVNTQDGARYRQNLEGAEKLQKELMIDVLKNIHLPLMGER